MSGWVRFENTTPENLKIATISDKAFRLWFNAICYCSRGKTSGRVPAALIAGLSVTATKKNVEELLSMGLLERLDAQTYLVHDYLDYNPSKERIDEMRKQNRDRVAGWRAKRDGNGVTGEDVTALREDYSHTRDRSVSGTSLIVDVQTTKDNSKPGRPTSKRADQDQLPANLPADLHETARQALGVLLAVQGERGGDEPTLRGVGLAIQRFPDRDHTRVVRELEHWALAGAGQAKLVKDWARTYGTFLDRTPAGRPMRVVHGGAGRETASEMLRAINGEAS